VAIFVLGMIWNWDMHGISFKMSELVSTFKCVENCINEEALRFVDTYILL
jgi:hypothetical protein